MLLRSTNAMSVSSCVHNNGVQIQVIPCSLKVTKDDLSLTRAQKMRRWAWHRDGIARLKVHSTRWRRELRYVLDRTLIFFIVTPMEADLYMSGVDSLETPRQYYRCKQRREEGDDA